MIHQFRAEIQPAEAEGTLTARLVPFGVRVPYGSGTVEFARGGIDYPPVVPLTVDHAPGVFSRVGVMTRHFESDEGAFAEFQLADTEDGRTLRELLKLGAVTDVSVGVAYDGDLSEKNVNMTGVLDHVSVVDHGRFSSDDVSSPAKVLAVHNDEEPIMAEAETVEATAPVVEKMAEFDDSELRAGLAELSERIERVQKPDDMAKYAEFSGLEVITALAMQRMDLPIANHALADVIGDLGSADASGIVPDYYWGAGLQFNVDKRRPLFNTAGPAPFPVYGNNIDVPKVTQETAVAKRSAQKAAAASQALQVEVNPYPIGWFAGAVDIALELISQSTPNVLSVVQSSLLKQYAIATESDATTAVAAVANHTGAVLTTDTYANLVADIITTSDLIEDATGAPGNFLAVTSAQWIAILSLMDGGDRRQFAMTNPQNADGSGSLVTRGIDVGGVFIFRSPHATTALQYNTDSFQAAEKTPMDVAVLNVELMGQDKGILGATAPITWAEGIYSYEIV